MCGSMIVELRALYTALMGRPANTPRYRTYPMPDGAGVAGAAVTLISGVADTWGAWIQIVAAAGVLQPQLIVGIQVTNPTAAGEYTIDIGTGAAAAEASVTAGGLPFRAIAAMPKGAHIIWLPYPIYIPVTTRIAMRCQDSVGAGNIDVKLITINGVAGNIGLGF